MTSTRDRNTPGNYNMDKQISIFPGQYQGYVHSSYGIAPRTYMPGTGLIGARIPRSELSTNSCDVESMLFGIGSCDLEVARPVIRPQLQHHTILNIHELLPLIIPPPIVTDIQDQKPMWLN